MAIFGNFFPTKFLLDKSYPAEFWIQGSFFLPFFGVQPPPTPNPRAPISSKHLFQATRWTPSPECLGFFLTRCLDVLGGSVGGWVGANVQKHNPNPPK